MLQNPSKRLMGKWRGNSIHFWPADTVTPDRGGDLIDSKIEL